MTCVVISVRDVRGPTLGLATSSKWGARAAKEHAGFCLQMGR